MHSLYLALGLCPPWLANCLCLGLTLLLPPGDGASGEVFGAYYKQQRVAVKVRRRQGASHVLVRSLHVGQLRSPCLSRLPLLAV